MAKRKFVIKNLKILPKVTEIAEKINTREAYEKADEILTRTTYEQAFAILTEAEQLLKALVKQQNDGWSVGQHGPDYLRILAGRGIAIGELGERLKVLTNR